MKKLLSLTCAVAAGATMAATPAKAGIDVFVGEIYTVAMPFCPRGTLPTNGQLLPIASNQALFSLLGTKYGGDGRTTFALPKISPKDDNGIALRSCIATQGVYPSRS